VSGRDRRGLAADPVLLAAALGSGGAALSVGEDPGADRCALSLPAQPVAARADAKGGVLRVEKVRRGGDVDDPEVGPDGRGRPPAVPDQQGVGWAMHHGGCGREDGVGAASEGATVRTLMRGDVWVHYGQVYVRSGLADLGAPDPELHACFAGQQNGLCGGAVPGCLC
jgi:hypothetical protein